MTDHQHQWPEEVWYTCRVLPFEEIKSKRIKNELTVKRVPCVVSLHPIQIKHQEQISGDRDGK